MPSTPPSRRDLLRAGAALGTASALAPFGRLALAAPPSEPAKPQGASTPNLSYQGAAVRAARWLRSTRLTTLRGHLWPNTPEHPVEVVSTPELYHGNAGIVLFLLELFRATKDRAHLREAERGGDYLASTLPEKLDLAQGEAALYVGVAGIGATLSRLAAVTQSEAHRQGAERCRDLVHSSAQAKGEGVQWGETTDIVGGGAGIGLYLLERARTASDPASLELAVRAARRLLELGIAEGGGKKWRMDPTFNRLMPNFSHGTAGIGYFLATLYLETKKPEHLAGALDAGRYLLSIADKSGDGCLLFHDEPDNPTLYYLGWCHGPAGTARLFYQLHRATGEGSWLEWARRGAESILRSGIPDRLTPGFWNNVGRCCGSAGVAELFLALHRLRPEERYLAFSRHLADDLLKRATPTPGDGLKWVHAENRRDPAVTFAQTGLMQGSAGIGLFLLHLDAVIQGKEWAFALPDSPWGGPLSRLETPGSPIQ